MPSQVTQHVFAATAEVRGNHLVFVDVKGSVAALFLRELVESWTEPPTKLSETSSRFVPWVGRVVT
jgi:hypothetical protein